jgi:hypothetical protein
MTDLLKQLEGLRREHDPDYCLGLDDFCECGASEHNRKLDECIAEEQARIEAERWRKWPELCPHVKTYNICHIWNKRTKEEYIHEYWFNEYGYWDVKTEETVTHWRPLPTPPTKEEE